MSSPEPQLTPMTAQHRRIKGELRKIGAHLVNVALSKRTVMSGEDNAKTTLVTGPCQVTWLGRQLR